MNSRIFRKGTAMIPLLLLSAVMIFTSCKEDEKKDPYFYIEGDISGDQVGGDGIPVTSTTITPTYYTIRSNRNWVIEPVEDYDWIRPFPTEGSDDGRFRFIVDEGSITTEREALFRFIVDGKEHTTMFNIKQDKSSLRLTSNPSKKVEIAALGGSQKVTVDANVPWEYEITLKIGDNLDWLTHTLDEKNAIINIEVANNEEPVVREANIRIFSDEYPEVGEINFALRQKGFAVYVPIEGLPAQWSFSADDYNNNTYNTAFELNNHLPATGGSSAFLSYVQRENPVDPDNKFERKVGTTGHPYITGAWPEDYWLYTVPVKGMPAGTNINIKFITRPSGSGHRFWTLEYYEGGEWKPAADVNNYVVEGLGTVQSTHDMKERTGTNLSVDVTFTYGTEIADGDLLIRFRCAANWQDGGGALEKPNGGTHRFAGAGTADSPYIINVP